MTLFLPMAATTMEAASTVETSAAVETATAVKATTAIEAAACHGAASESTAPEAASDAPACREAGSTEVLCRESTAAETASANKTGSAKAASVATPAEARPKAKSAEPWAGTDEDPSREPIGTVKTVRRASVRVIVVVAIRANRCGVDIPIARANSHSKCHSLRVGKRRAKHANSQQTRHP